MGRLFNHKQKQALYWIAGGICEGCGEPLPAHWHADHIQPHATGGPTDVVNGQALCPTCNLKKGAGAMFNHWPPKLALRRWQQEFLNKYNALDKPDFLLVATPGGGKTTAALRVTHDLLRSGIVQRLVVVCPSDHLRTQWLYEAAKVGIQLDKKTIGYTGAIAQTTDYVGLVTTYAEVLFNIEPLRAYTSRHKTLVIFDEVHHCGEHENLQWGVAINKSFDLAVRRLLLSGTPFRTDNNRIPFVEYEPDPAKPGFSHSKADHTYGYGDALKDGEVVRHIIFSGWDGEFAWNDSFWGEERKASFQSLLNRVDSNRRLKTAINPDEMFMRKMLVSACEKLDEVRRDGHTNAGGLVVAESQDAAKSLAKILEEVNGEKPVLAVSDMGDAASGEIKKFHDGTQKWIVAVKMVSEGVDIKRLRVGVYATNVKTDTFFRQVIGRVIRWDNRWADLYDQTAYFYIPEDPTLLRLAKAIKEELDHYIEEREEADKKDKSTDAGVSPPMQTMMSGEYEILYSEGDEKHHHTSGETFPIDEVEAAKQRFSSIPGFEKMPGAALALALRELGITGQTQTVLDSDPEVVMPPPAFAQKKTLQQTVHKKLGRLVFLCREKGISLPYGVNPHQAINNAWGRARRYSNESTNSELEDKLNWLEDLIARVIKGDKSVVSVFH